MELPFFVSNNHRSRNTDRHGNNFPLNGRKGEGGSGQTDYGDGQKQETDQCAGYKPLQGDISFPHIVMVSLCHHIMIASKDPGADRPAVIVSGCLSPGHTTVEQEACRLATRAILPHNRRDGPSFHAIPDSWSHCPLPIRVTNPGQIHHLAFALIA